MNSGPGRDNEDLDLASVDDANESYDEADDETGVETEIDDEDLSNSEAPAKKTKR